MGKQLESIPKFTRALIKSHLVACGYTYEDANKPIVAIVNSWTEFNHGHISQDKIAKKVKEGIIDRGGLPLEFDTIAPCDALAQGYDAMNYILPSREIIADSIEVMIKSQNIVDGIVFISSCDKITPGMLMAAMRLDLPCVHICGGSCDPAITFAESKNLRKSFLEGRISEKELVEGNAQLYPQPGICPYIGTANSMDIVAEALGLTATGSSTIPSCTNRRSNIAVHTGKIVMDLIEKDMKPSKFINKRSFNNVLRVIAAVSGSLNTVLHVPAIAYEAGIELDFDYIDVINSEIPQLCTINPNGSHSVADLDRGGGVPAVMKQLEDFIDLDARNVEGKTMQDVVEKAKVKDESIIRPVSDPVYRQGGIVILKGNIAQKGAAARRSTIKDGMKKFSGPARVFNSEDETTEAIKQGKIKNGDVVVIRYEGPKGGPGMRELHRIAGALKSIGERIAVVTDGRFSGATGGLAVGYISPEAASKGEIAIIEDGDIIEIDVEKKSINLKLSDGEIEERMKSLSRPEKKVECKLLKEFSNQVGPTYIGAPKIIK